MDQFMYILELIDKYIWGIPLCALIIGCGIWLTLRVHSNTWCITRPTEKAK